MHNGLELFLAALACGVLNFTAARFSAHDIHPFTLLLCYTAPTNPAWKTQFRPEAVLVRNCGVFAVHLKFYASPFSEHSPGKAMKSDSAGTQYSLVHFSLPAITLLCCTSLSFYPISTLSPNLVRWGWGLYCLCMICLANTLFSKTHCLSTRHKYWVGNGGMVRS